MFANREIYELIYNNGVSIIKSDAEKRNEHLNKIIEEFLNN